MTVLVSSGNRPLLNSNSLMFPWISSEWSDTYKLPRRSSDTDPGRQSVLGVMPTLGWPPLLHDTPLMSVWPNITSTTGLNNGSRMRNTLFVSEWLTHRNLLSAVGAMPQKGWYAPLSLICPPPSTFSGKVSVKEGCAPTARGRL